LFDLGRAATAVAFSNPSKVLSPNIQSRRRRVLKQQLRDAWRVRERAVRISPVMNFTPEGLVLGAGTVLLAANGGHADVLRFTKGDDSVKKQFLEQALRQVQASGGRPIVWIFAEEETAEIARKLFKQAGQGRERIIIVHTEWKRP
jgi:hypothetical protein